MKIGDIIRAKINHSEGVYSAGEQFPLQGVYPCPSCGKEWVDIGVLEEGKWVHSRCVCGGWKETYGRRLFWKSNFEKAEAEDSYMEKLIKQAFKLTLL